MLEEVGATVDNEEWIKNVILNKKDDNKVAGDLLYGTINGKKFLVRNYPFPTEENDGCIKIFIDNSYFEYDMTDMGISQFSMTDNGEHLFIKYFLHDLKLNRINCKNIKKKMPKIIHEIIAGAQRKGYEDIPIEVLNILGEVNPLIANAISHIIPEEELMIKLPMEDESKSAPEK